MSFEEGRSASGVSEKAPHYFTFDAGFCRQSMW
jgi:hypothetical protein